jgi:hypothetical protein
MASALGFSAGARVSNAQFGVSSPANGFFGEIRADDICPYIAG